jgi:hypothetical protein
VTIAETVPGLGATDIVLTAAVLKAGRADTARALGPEIGIVIRRMARARTLLMRLRSQFRILMVEDGP